MAGHCHLGSFVCEAGHELRITCRCLRVDLETDPPSAFEALADGHPIVHAFRSKRSTETGSGKTVGPANADLTLYRLASGHDHRGATWFEPSAGVVWLCAAHGRHRSGQPGDAFPYFHGLIRTGEIWPTSQDHAWLERDRAVRLAELLPEAAQELLAHARSQPNVELRAVIGGGAVGIVVEVVDTLEETYVAFMVATMGDPTRLVALLAAFYPERTFGDWGYRDHLPARPLQAGELCMSILHA